MTCQTCGHENLPDNAFCGACGLRLIHECGACGQVSAVGNIFCGKCGQRLIEEDPAAAAAKPETGERKQLTVLFCDLVGSTDLSARLDPEEYREGLHEYYARAEEVITRYGGFVAQHLGDGLLVYFGWPQTFDDSAERAVHAGLGLIAVTATVKAGGAPLAARVGLHTGAAVVSDIGAGHRRETLALGDTPNIAARAQASAQPGEVVITAATHKLVAGLFIVEDRGPHRLKGVPEPVQLFSVTQTSGARGRLGASASRGFTPFVNRTEERALLRSRFDRVCDGEGQVVLLSGEAGIGKSRLAQVLGEEIADTPHTWLETAASPHYTNTPFHAVAELLRQRRSWEDDEPGPRAERLASALRRLGMDPAETLPLIAPLLNVPVPDDYPKLSAAPAVARRRLLTCLATWLFATARQQPLVILIEDLQWLDPSTLELLQLLVEQVATAPILILATARPEFQAPWPARANNTQLMLSRLPRRHVQEMVRGVAAHVMLLAEVIDEVAARTDGVPLFVEELTKAVAEAGAVAAARQIPATLNDSLMARLDRLGAGAKEAAQIAAVCGREFTFEMMREMHPIAEEELESALQKLVDAELLHARGMPPDATYTFKHALVQDAAYESLLKSRRRQLHGQAAAVLMQRFPEVADERPELLAHHQEAGELWEAAVGAWQQAGERAFARGANREAERYLERGLALLDRLPDRSQHDWIEFQLLLSLGAARIGSQGFGAPAAEQALEQAMQRGERLAEPLQLGVMLLGRIGLEAARNGPTMAQPLCDRLLEVAGRSRHATLQAAAEFSAGLLDFHRGNLAAARARFERGITLYDETLVLPFPIDAGLALQTFLADTNWRLGRVAEAVSGMRDALARTASLPRTADRAWTFQHAALLFAFLRDPERAGEHAQISLDACAEEPNPTIGILARAVRGWSLAAQGKVDAGRVMIMAALSEVSASEQRLGLELLHCLLADAHAAAGDLDGALRLLAEGESAWPDQVGDRPQTLIRRATLLAAGRQPAAVVTAAFDDALAIARSLGARSYELRAAIAYARWLRDQGQLEAAARLLLPIVDAWTDPTDTADLRDARELATRLAAAESADVPVAAVASSGGG